MTMEFLRHAALPRSSRAEWKYNAVFLKSSQCIVMKCLSGFNRGDQQGQLVDLAVN